MVLFTGLLKFLAEENTDSRYVTYVIIWAAIFLVATFAFVVTIHFARRFFTCHAVIEVYKDKDGIHKKVTYCRHGEIIQTKNMKLARKFPGIKPISISSDSEIEQGNLEAFLMPHGDVRVVFGYAEKKAPEISRVNSPKTVLPLPPSIQKTSDELLRPLLLLSVLDVEKHLEETNSLTGFPLLNSYRYTILDEKEVMILKGGEQIYAIAISSEAVFKTLVRLDAAFAKDKLNDIDSLAHISGDIYSLILDSTFGSIQRYFSILDHAYAYVLLTDYTLEEGHYILNKSQGEKANSSILAFNEKISREFDPVYDRSIEEAKKYRQALMKIFKKERELDAQIITERSLVYEELEKSKEELAQTQDDVYKVNNDFVDGPYVEEEKKEEPEIVVKKGLPDINEDLSDLRPVRPSPLSIEKLIDYIMEHKDMVSLTIDLSNNMKKTPTTMKFLSSYFALIMKGKLTYRINLKMDGSYIQGMAKDHPNIIHVHNGIEEDWYRLTLDETYKTYEELYKILLESYEYTKNVAYARQQSLEEEAGV